MRMRKTGVNLGGAGALCASGISLLLDMFEARSMIEDAFPVLVRAFLPSIGFGLALGGSAWLLGTMIAIDARKAEQLASDLDRFANDLDAMSQGVSQKRLPRRETNRFFVQGEKYRAWLAQRRDDKATQSWGPDSAQRASHYAEVLRAYGYTKGRLKIASMRHKERKRDQS